MFLKILQFEYNIVILNTVPSLAYILQFEYVITIFVLQMYLSITKVTNQTAKYYNDT